MKKQSKANTDKIKKAEIKQIISNNKEELDTFGLNENQRTFCREYIFDWNGSRAYKVAYPDVTEESVRSCASQLLTKLNINEYIEFIQNDLAKLAGISQLKVLNEHMKLAFNSIAHLHNTWIELKEFEDLSEDQKACISEISTQTKTEKRGTRLVDIDFVKIKLYDKQKALDSISKMLGYDAAVKLDIPNLPRNLSITIDSSETALALKKLKEEFSKSK